MRGYATKRYRNKRSRMESAIESCLKGGSYPRNQKLKNLYKEQKKKFAQKTYLKQQIAEIPPTMKIKDTITDTSMVTRLSLATSSSVSTVDTTCP